MSSGRWSTMLRALWAWHRWIRARAPKTSRTALVKAFDPSRTTRVLRSVRRPRSRMFAEQRRAGAGVLRRPLPDPEDVLPPVAVEAERHQQNVLVDVHAVDHQH